MDYDDIVYISLLIFTIVIGHFYRSISDYHVKRRLSTGLGVLIVLFVSGIHIIHPVICVLVNAFIILGTSKKTCHVVSFAFSFLYLLFFRTTIYFNIPYPPAHTNLIQMMFTLKLVGLAFEVRDSHELEKKEALLDPPPKEKREYLRPSFWDIIHFSFCYIGILTGPYYTYQTYQDYFKTEFYKVAPCVSETMKKLRLLPVFAAIFLLLSHYYPLKFMETDDFYNETTFFSRLVYMNAIFTTFRCRIYIGLILSECACTMAGLGAYPKETVPRPGLGPSTKQEIVQKLTADKVLAEQQEYDFESVHNIDPIKCEVPSFRQTIKYWNMCIQYWLAFVVYKRFPSKAFRTAAVFAVSAFWHGVYLGYYFCLLAPPFYLPIEDIWEKIAQRDTMTGLKRKLVDFLFWFMRMEAFTFMGIAFSLLHTQSVLRFYKSIYYVFYVICAIGLVIGLVILNTKRVSKKSKNEEKKEQ